MNTHMTTTKPPDATMSEEDDDLNCWRDDEVEEASLTTINAPGPSVLGSWSNLPRPDLIVPEAYTDHPLRIPRQLAAATDTTLEAVIKRFDELFNGTEWRDGGCCRLTAHDIFRYGADVGVSTYMYDGSFLAHFKVQQNAHQKIIAFARWCGRMYFYRGIGPTVRNQAQNANFDSANKPATKRKPLHTLAKSCKHPPKNVEDFIEFPWHLHLADVPAGFYWVPSQQSRELEEEGQHITGILTKFLISNRFPRVSKLNFDMDDHKPYELTYHKTPGMDNGTGMIVIRSHALDARTTHAWAQRLRVPYAGQSLGPFTNMVLDQLLRTKQRRYLNDAEKTEVVQRQVQQCALCHDTLGADVAYDHTVPLHDMTTDQTLDSFQAICGQCHADKTKAEARPCVGILRSHFNANVWAHYVESPKPPSMAYKDGDIAEQCSTSACRTHAGFQKVRAHMAVDVVRSRYSALYEIPDPGLPIFTALDDIRPVNPAEDLPDLIYIDKDATSTTIHELVSALPFHGRAWYMRPAVEYLLHTKRVSWSELKWGIRASSHMPGDRLREALDVMQEAWEDVLADFQALGISPDRVKPAKDSVNCWVGYCGMPSKSVSLRTVLSFDAGDNHLSGALWSTQDAYGIKGLWEFTRITRVVDSATYRPIYDWCLAVEHTRIAQAWQAMQAIYKIVRLPCPLVNVTVDGFIFERPRKSVTADKVKAIVEALTFASLPSLEDTVRRLLEQPDPKQKRLKTADLYPIRGRTTDAPVFRVVTPEARQHLRGKHSMPTRVWPTTYQQPVWEHVNVEEAKTLVRHGHSLCVKGLAGVGKSYLIREMVAELEAAGKHVITIAKTHNAALVAGGDTADHFAWKHVREGGTGTDVVWADEISMLDTALLQDLNHLSFRDPPVQWILSGDFNQFEPFFNTFLGQPVQRSFNNSDLLALLCGGKCLLLTECKRSDQFLFDWYASLVREPKGCRFGKPLQAVLQECRAEFAEARATGFLPGSRLAPTNIVISHKLRECVNAQCNAVDMRGRNDAEQFTLMDFGIEPVANSNNPQDAWFWHGLHVVACCRGRKLRNGRDYEILKIGSKVVEVQAEGEEPLELRRSEFFRSMRLRYAVTYASAQGLTLEGLVALHDTSHHHFDWRKLYVAMSRARGRDKIIVY